LPEAIARKAGAVQLLGYRWTALASKKKLVKLAEGTIDA